MTASDFASALRAAKRAEAKPPAAGEGAEIVKHKWLDIRQEWWICCQKIPHTSAL